MNIRIVALRSDREELEPPWSGAYEMNLGFDDTTSNKIKSWWGQWSRTSTPLSEYTTLMIREGSDIQPVVYGPFCNI